MCIGGEGERGTERVGKKKKKKKFHTGLQTKQLLFCQGLSNVCALLQVMKTAWSFRTTADIYCSV